MSTISYSSINQAISDRSGFLKGLSKRKNKLKTETSKIVSKISVVNCGLLVKMKSQDSVKPSNAI